MEERTFLGTFTAIMLASVPAWACALICGGAQGAWRFLDAPTALGSVFWIPASLLTFVAMWVLRQNCRHRPALLVAAAGIVPFSILSTLFLLDIIEPVLHQLFDSSGGMAIAAFAGLLMVLQGVYVASSYLVAGGSRSIGLPRVYRPR